MRTKENLKKNSRNIRIYHRHTPAYGLFVFLVFFYSFCFCFIHCNEIVGKFCHKCPHPRVFLFLLLYKVKVDDVFVLMFMWYVHKGAVCFQVHDLRVTRVARTGYT